jgi:D-inositol-3-phosphate glycosyltransferase
MRAVMGCADAGVIPSLSSETNCRVTMEFFSVGTPVVAFPTGALPEVIQDGVSGLVTPDHTPEHLAAALQRVLQDGGLRESLATGALQAARGRFSRAGFLDQTLTAFEAARRRTAARSH